MENNYFRTTKKIISGARKLDGLGHDALPLALSNNTHEIGASNKPTLLLSSSRTIVSQAIFEIADMTSQNGLKMD